MSAVLMGYDVESFAIGEGLARLPNHGLTTAREPESCTRGLKVITSIHESLGVSATLFVCGKTLLHNIPALRDAAAREYFDIQQHTYSHVLFKPDDWQGGGFRQSTPEALEHEVSATSGLLARYLGVRCIGLRTPHGYHRGVSDQPGNLRMLHDAGIRFVSSWGRNEQGGNPTPFDRQPFWYDQQGYADILEIPFQGWLDATWFEQFGPDDADGYVAVLKQAADLILQQDLVYGVCFHDWAMIHYQEARRRWVRRFLEHVLELGIPVLSYRQYYEAERDKRNAA
jgi:peptidoglycan/xylan/chitin deacetylase (PgdA/CDA1 family)